MGLAIEGKTIWLSHILTQNGVVDTQLYLMLNDLLPSPVQAPFGKPLSSFEGFCCEVFVFLWVCASFHPCTLQVDRCDSKLCSKVFLVVESLVCSNKLFFPTQGGLGWVGNSQDKLNC